jgi:predicted nucleotide-binding protein
MYQTYIDEDNEEKEFTVFIIHGHSEDWRKVERYIKEHLKFNTIVLKEAFVGKVVFDKFRNAIWDKAECAVAILSPDDKMALGNYRARQNVLYEIGYCQAVFDSLSEEGYEYEPITILKEESIDIREVSDLLGIEILSYKNSQIENVFHILGTHLNNIYDELVDA